MAVSIQHQGILQNLLLEVELDDRGQWTGKFGAVGGETRRLGLCLLRDGGVPGATGFDDDYEVPGLIVEGPNAMAASATENIRRTQLHPADEFEAFKELHDQCGSVEHVAAYFAVKPLVVEQRLKLANASPKLFQLYREGGMTIEQLMALCLTDDHGRQEKIWQSGARCEYMRGPRQLRHALTEGRVSLSGDRVARFVGAIAYEAAGGGIVRDLFSENGEDGYIADGELLRRLALDKLEAQAASVRAEGWAWVLVIPVFDYAEQSRYDRCEVRRRSTVEAFAKPFAGAVVAVDQSGQAVTLRGLIKPEDRKAYQRAARAKDREKASDVNTDGGERLISGASADAGQGLSRVLSLRLGAQRTAALQVMVARNVSLALVSLAHSLVTDVLLEGYYPQRTLRVSATAVRDRLTGLDGTMGESRAFKELEVIVEAWMRRLPEEGLFDWLRALPPDELLQLIALCSALTINTVSDHALEAQGLDGEGALMAKAAGLDMADWWEPTAASFLGSVSKEHVMAALAEGGVLAEASAPLAKLKKGEMVARAEALLSGKRWLPALLRQPTA
jgi:ParB family chromosome partitioning protein